MIFSNKKINAIAPYFDVNFYLSQIDNKSIADDPLIHFLNQGWKEGLDPSPSFSTLYYLEDHQDVAAQGLNPLLHYALKGRAEGRSVRPSSVAEARNTMALAEARKLFDDDFYLQQLGGAQPSTDLFEHFLSEGAMSGLDPCPDFSTQAYRDEHSDVAASGLNPFLHFVLTGRSEGRAIHPSTFSPQLNSRELAEPYIDNDFYRSQLPDGLEAQDPVDHFLREGWLAGIDPAPNFSVERYLNAHPDVADSGENPFLHWIVFGSQERREVFESAVAERKRVAERTAIADCFDEQFYLSQLGDEVELSDPLEHYLTVGWREGLDPSPTFSTQKYIDAFPDVAAEGQNPLRHWVLWGRAEGREVEQSQKTMPKLHEEGPPAVEEEPEARDDFLSRLYFLKPHFDAEFYKKNNKDELPEGCDLIEHYLTVGWLQGRDPSPDFSVTAYVRKNVDVAASRIEPYYHYLTQGILEGRKASPSAQRVRDQDVSAFDAHRFAVSPGPEFEAPEPQFTLPEDAGPKPLAFYLPQFHAFEENDKWWGEGFTEWRNLSKALPRFSGHRQPRIPRDLGFYSLDNADALRAQATLARSFGVYGFAIYYYFFNGKRLMERPLELLLEHRDIDIPFCLIWANENWTRTWDGFDADVLISQDYWEEDEENLLADWVRHFKDDRYIRVGGRPLIIIYRPGIIPDCAEKMTRWRAALEKEYGERPFFVMAQGFGDSDPREFGMDAAIEFPPHKLLHGEAPINESLQVFDPEFSGNVFDYKTLIERSRNEDRPNYPLIKSVTLAWDNEARRPGRGMTMTNFSPKLYERWLGEVAEFARSHPVGGESFVGINAWNEWAEGVYLEPDTHYGHALLNATARAIAPRVERRKILLVGHDAHRHGAQTLLLNLARVLKKGFGYEVATLLLGPGSLTAEYEKLGRLATAGNHDKEHIKALLSDFANAGFKNVIVNTVASGVVMATIRELSLQSTCLVHELPRVIKDMGLVDQVKAIGSSADTVVVPGERVRAGFEELAGGVSGALIERPQGLYSSGLLSPGSKVDALHEILDLPDGSKIVMNMAFGDWRKGFDLFVRVAEKVLANRDDVVFVWAGNVSRDVDQWIVPDLDSFSGRIVVTDYIDDLEPYFRGADVFLLSSREDPFPSVVLEALATGLPVVGFDGVGDCESLIRKHGALVKRGDLSAAADAVCKMLDRPDAVVKKAKAAARRFINTDFDFADYAMTLTETFRAKPRRVSVVVPNYNYEDHIEARLVSIFKQTYPVYEIIVLDDQSSDRSVERIRETARQYDRDIEVVVNKKNSGSVFSQWRKGAKKARGDYVWIAEADDVADPKFLESLLESQDGNEFTLAFSDSWQIDENGWRIGESYSRYCGVYTDNLFDDDFRLPGSTFLRDCLSVRNVIMNVSAVIWKKSALLEAFNDVGEDIMAYRVAGDWLLYTEVCKLQESEIVYVAKALNGHRRHQTSVTHALNTDKHIAEIVDLQKRVASTIELPPKMRNRQKAAIKEVRAHFQRLANAQDGES